MKKGVIVINAYSELEHSLNQSRRMKEELEKLGVSTTILRNNTFLASVENRDGDLVNKLEDYDFCLYLDKDKYVSDILEKKGMRLFNRHQAIRYCDDKAVTCIQLAEHGIPMPKTLFGLLCYDPDKDVKSETLDIIERELGYPMIAKESYGALGKNVYKVDNRKELEEKAVELKSKPHLFQEYVSTSYGRDVRVIVIGGKVVATMLRKSDKDFRSNIELGGMGFPFEVGDKVKAQCVKIAEILGLEYCGIDLLFGKEKDEFLVCEVNSNAFFGGMEEATGINVGKAYAEYIYDKVYN